MVVLTRRVGESVVIGDDVYCTVRGYRNGEVQLAFDVPESVPVHFYETQRRTYQDHWLKDSTPQKMGGVVRFINKVRYAISPFQFFGFCRDIKKRNSFYVATRKEFTPARKEIAKAHIKQCKSCLFK